MRSLSPTALRPLTALMFGALLCPNLARAQAFEAASVKPIAGPLLPGQQGFHTGPGSVTARAQTLKDLIQQAYGVNALEVTGGPDWIGTARFDMEAKAASPSTRGELLQMLQGLLAERFQLSLHRAQKELPVSALVMGKDTAKLQRSAELQPGESGDPVLSSRAQQASGLTQLEISGQRITLPYLANYLSGRFDRIVVDRTGASGEFDFRVLVAIDRDEVADPKVPERVAVAHIYEDLAKDLGLKLESQKAQVEVLVIDRAERPGPN